MSKTPSSKYSSKKDVLKKNIKSSISNIPPEKWKETVENEERDLNILAIREELITNVLEKCYNFYLEKQSVLFTGYCAYLAWKQLFQWEFCVRDKGEHCYENNPKWARDKPSIPSEPDSWSANSMPIIEKVKTFDKWIQVDTENFPQDICSDHSSDQIQSVKSILWNDIQDQKSLKFELKNDMQIAPNKLKLIEQSKKITTDFIIPLASANQVTDEKSKIMPVNIEKYPQLHGEIAENKPKSLPKKHLPRLNLKKQAKVISYQSSPTKTSTKDLRELDSNTLHIYSTRFIKLKAPSLVNPSLYPQPKSKLSIIPKHPLFHQQKLE